MFESCQILPMYRRGRGIDWDLFSTLDRVADGSLEWVCQCRARGQVVGPGRPACRAWLRAASTLSGWFQRAAALAQHAYVARTRSANRSSGARSPVKASRSRTSSAHLRPRALLRQLEVSPFGDVDQVFGNGFALRPAPDSRQIGSTPLASFTRRGPHDRLDEIGRRRSAVREHATTRRSRVDDPAMDRYDAIVIGSGIGGLSCATYLAKQAHKRVLILERHFQLGGLTQEFARAPGWRWPVGVHYIGAGPDRHVPILEYIANGELEWTTLPDPYDVFMYPDFKFGVPVGEEQYRDALVTRFPEERDGIDSYLRDVHSAANWMTGRMMGAAIPSWLGALTNALIPSHHGLALQTTKSVIDSHVRTPQLRALLASQWGDYGLPPAQSAFGIHALVTSSFYQGAVRPKGGPRAIARGALRGIEAAGGAARLSREVVQVRVEGNQCRGVIAEHRKADGSIEIEEYDAPIVVSDAGAVHTYQRLVDSNYPLPFRRSIESFPHGPSAVVTYLGLRESPARIGLSGENRWIFDGYDHDELAARAGELLSSQPHHLFASFPTVREPEVGHHTAELLTILDASVFDRWRDTQHGERGADYEALRRSMADAMLARADAAIPGLADLVEASEVSTPLSFEHFVGRAHGSFYGVPAIPRRYELEWTRPETPIRGLWLTGSDVASLGVMGAAIGGAITASRVIGLMGMPSVFSTMGGAH